MTTQSDLAKASILNNMVQSLLPSARIEIFSLDQSPIKLYLINKDYPRDRLEQEVAIALMEQPFYWAFCWASGAVLANYLFAHPELVRGKRVLDFGCGSGVVAIAAALNGAKEVIACDIDSCALTACDANAQLNNVELSLADDYMNVSGSVDVILAADVLYDRENLHWLEKFQAKAACVIVADSRIRNFDYAGYVKQNEYEAFTLPDLDESQEFRRVSVYISNSNSSLS